MGATTTVMSTTSVPESVLKKRKTQEKIGAEKAAAAEVAKKERKEKRVAAYKSAEKYVKEYRAIAKQRVRMHRQAKAAGNHSLMPRPSSSLSSASVVSPTCTLR